MKAQAKEFNTTPCVGRCSTVYGDPICRGCKRFITEVSLWNQLPFEQRQTVWLRLEQLAIRIIPQYLIILDANLLKAFLQAHAIRYPMHLTQESWALHCLENFPTTIDQLHQAGLRLAPQSEPVTTMKELKLRVQKRLYQLSLAEQTRHYQIPSATAAT